MSLLLTGVNVEAKTLDIAVKTASDAAGKANHGAQLKIEIQGLDHSGSDQFRAMMERFAGGTGAPAVGKAGGADNGKSLGNAIAGRASGLATEIKKDQEYVSKLLEQATRSGDEMHMLRAMMALSDFQLRVQTISKTVSKAATSIDSLTKLQ
jgi:hypothetical protein